MVWSRVRLENCVPVLAVDLKTLTPTQIRRQELEMKIVWQLSVIFELILS